MSHCDRYREMYAHCTLVKGHAGHCFSGSAFMRDTHASGELLALRAEVERLRADREAYGMRIAKAVKRACADVADSPRESLDMEHIDLAALVKGIE